LLCCPQFACAKSKCQKPFTILRFATRESLATNRPSPALSFRHQRLREHASAMRKS
jgi:hypothetical protein